MERDAKKLRDKLFETLFIEDGILLSDLMGYLSPYIEAWSKLHVLLEKNIEGFDKFSNLDTIKVINDKYLIIKQHMWNYLIIDIDTKKVLKKENIVCLFDEKSFIDNFKEEKIEFGNKWFKYYYFFDFEGDVQSIIDLYNDDKEILESTTKIFYKNNIDDAYIYMSINIVSGEIQIGFYTPDQFLYEHLLINQDLTPFGLQDATNRIGHDKIREMFSRINDIKVPIRYIPEEILKNIDELEQNKKGNSLTKTKI